MKILLTACLVLCVPNGHAQRDPAHASFDPQTHNFRLDGGRVTYVFGIAADQTLQTQYWGPRLAPSDKLPQTGHDAHDVFDVATAPQEFAGWGGGLLSDPGLKVTLASGNRDLVLHYRSHVLTADGVDVTLRDINEDIFVTLHYVIDPSTGIVARSATVENRTGAPLAIEQMAAATWNLPAGTSYKLRSLSGRWGAEDNLTVRSVEAGATVLESRRGSTGHEEQPWFEIAQDGAVGEESGRVWFGSLAWSGSWRISVEQDVLKQVRVTGGFNSFDFSWSLKPGEHLDSPIFYGGFSSEGFGAASRLLHHFERASVLPHGPEQPLRKVLYNSWEATGFKVTEAGQIALAEKAAQLGVERFTMDDGWFGQRNSDHAGLGDWKVNPQKFPNGLKPVIDRVHALGMDFGLWVEPEMVNPDSDLYRAHPDWILHFPNRPQTESRHQYVLNLARSDVADYIFHAVDDLLSNNEISFIKWDYNRNWSEPGWPDAPVSEQKEVYVTYVRNLYNIIDRLRQRHPNVEFEACSGGGGRTDLGMLRRVDQAWTSDDTDAFNRLRIQSGFSQIFTPGVMMAWVTDSPNWLTHRSLSLNYRFLSAMQGSLGIGADLTKLTPQEMTQSAAMIAVYKTIRPIVQRGDLYRLMEPSLQSEYVANEFVAPDRGAAAVFVFLHTAQLPSISLLLPLRGLDPAANYRLESIGNSAIIGPQTASGEFWMGHGITVKLAEDFTAAGFHLVRTK